MNPKRKIRIAILLLMGVLITAVAALYVSSIKPCLNMELSGHGCGYILRSGYSIPLLRALPGVIVLSFIALLFKREVAQSFFYYLLVIVPIVIIGLFASPMDDSGGIFLSLDGRESMAEFYLVLSVISGILVLLVRSIQVSGKRKQTS